MSYHLDADISDRREATPSATFTLLKAVRGIADQWQLTRDQLAVLLRVPKSTLNRWLGATNKGEPPGGQLDQDQVDRISYLLGIYKALHVLFPDAEQANGWVHRANSAPGFAGRSALDVMLGGRMSDLQAVRRHLDGWRG